MGQSWKSHKCKNLVRIALAPDLPLPPPTDQPNMMGSQVKIRSNGMGSKYTSGMNVSVNIKFLEIFCFSESDTDEPFLFGLFFCAGSGSYEKQTSQQSFSSLYDNKEHPNNSLKDTQMFFSEVFSENMCVCVCLSAHMLCQIYFPSWQHNFFQASTRHTIFKGTPWFLMETSAPQVMCGIFVTNISFCSPWLIWDGTDPKVFLKKFVNFLWFNISHQSSWDKVFFEILVVNFCEQKRL